MKGLQRETMTFTLLKRSLQKLIIMAFGRLIYASLS